MLTREKISLVVLILGALAFTGWLMHLHVQEQEIDRRAADRISSEWVGSHSFPAEPLRPTVLGDPITATLTRDAPDAPDAVAARQRSREPRSLQDLIASELGALSAGERVAEVVAVARLAATPEYQRVLGEADPDGLDSMEQDAIERDPKARALRERIEHLAEAQLAAGPREGLEGTHLIARGMSLAQVESALRLQPDLRVMRSETRTAWGRQVHWEVLVHYLGPRPQWTLLRTLTVQFGPSGHVVEFTDVVTEAGQPFRAYGRI